MPRTNNVNKSEDHKETDDIKDRSQCIHLQSRSRQQVPVLPNAERFELQKKYQLIRRLMIRGVPTTYYVRFKNALEDCACLFIWCTNWKAKINWRETLMKCCKYDKQLLVRCNNSDFDLLKCDNVFSSYQSFGGIRQRAGKHNSETHGLKEKVRTCDGKNNVRYHVYEKYCTL
jgi:hypothetical protein